MIWWRAAGTSAEAGLFARWAWLWSNAGMQRNAPLSRAWPWSLALACLGCSGGSSGDEAGESAPSCADELELRLGEFIEEGQPLALLKSGDSLHLWNAPQGGHVVTVGAEVGGLVTSIVEIEARLIDPETDEVLKDDLRSIVMKPIEDDDGWMTPDIRSRSQVAHLPMCPDSEGRQMIDRELHLAVEIRETESECQATGKASVAVVPGCLQEDDDDRAFCECQCATTDGGTCSL